jgi:hypothetical protein
MMGFSSVDTYWTAFMIARGWGVLPVHLTHSKEQATLPSPAGDHEDHPYGSSGLLSLFMASVDAYWAIFAVALVLKSAPMGLSPLHSQKVFGREL